MMKALSWNSIAAGGFPLTAPPDGPERFIRVFNTKKAAQKFAEAGGRLAEVEEEVDLPPQASGMFV